MITVAQFLNYVKSTNLQNISDDFGENDTWLYFINQANMFVYNYIASAGSWYRANKTEILTPVSPKVFNTTYGIGRVLDVKDGSGGELWPVNISLDMNYVKTDDEPEPGYVRGEASNQIRTATETNTITITYLRMPKWHTIDNLNEVFDCPIEAQTAVILFLNWLLMPIHLENGASLANNYYQQAITYIETYMKNLSPDNRSFTA